MASIFPLNKISPVAFDQLQSGQFFFRFAVKLSSGIFIYFSLVLNYFFFKYIYIYNFLYFFIPLFCCTFSSSLPRKGTLAVNCLKLCISENTFVVLLYLIFNLAEYELLVRYHFLSFSIDVEIGNAIQSFYSVLFLWNLFLPSLETYRVLSLFPLS